MVIGERLKELRNDAALSQKELGARLNVSDKSIGCYEREEVAPPDEVKLEMAKLFNISLDYLLGLIDDPIPYYRSNVIVLPKDFPQESLSDVRRYVRLLTLEHKSKEKNP